MPYTNIVRNPPMTEIFPVRITRTMEYTPEAYLEFCAENEYEPTQEGFYEFIQDWIDEDFRRTNDPRYHIQILHLHKMTIDLEQFVGKECVITLNNDRVFESLVEKSDSNSYPYLLKNGEYIHTFTRKGIYDDVYPENGMAIKSIRLKTPTKPMNTPELPESTIEKLAEVLSPDAVKYITETEEYVTFMTEMLTEFVRERMGNLIENVECEIVSTMVSDKIDLKVVK